jgi:hypothetical protein
VSVHLSVHCTHGYFDERGFDGTPSVEASIDDDDEARVEFVLQGAQDAAQEIDHLGRGGGDGRGEGGAGGGGGME